MSASHTRGPWKVLVDEHPHYLGGKHVERRIFTEWHHPQLKGPASVVTGSIGIGPTKGGQPIHMVSLGEADANLIAAAPELLEALVELRDWYADFTGLPAAKANAAINKAKGAA